MTNRGASNSWVPLAILGLVLGLAAEPVAAQQALGPRALANSKLLEPKATAWPMGFACNRRASVCCGGAGAGLTRVRADGSVGAQRALRWQDGWGFQWPKPGGGFAVVLNREREAEPFTIYEPRLLDFDRDLVPQGKGMLLRRPDEQYPFSYLWPATAVPGGFVAGHLDVALGERRTGIALSFFDEAGKRLRPPVLVASLIYAPVAFGFTEESQWIAGLVVDPVDEVLSVVYVRRRNLGLKTGVEGVFLRRYSLAASTLGEALGEPERLLGSEDDYFLITVASNASGDFALVWGSRLHGERLRAHRADRTGRLVGDSFEVNPDRRYWHMLPSASMDERGRLLVAWEQWDDEAPCRNDRWSYLTLRLRAFDRSNRPLGPAMVLACGWQADSPKVHFSGNGVFLAAWSDFGRAEQLGDRVWVQRFSLPD